MQKTKIAHVITRMIIGGAQENTLYTVCGLMADPRYDVTLVTGPAVGPEGSLMDAVRRNNVPTISIPYLRRNLHLVYDVLAFMHLVSVLWRGKYTVVHTHSSKAGILGRLAAWIARVPYIVHTIHGLPFHAHEHPVRNACYRSLECLVAPMTDRIITVCDEMAVQARAAGIVPRGGYTTIYSGLDLDLFTRTYPEEAAAIRQKFALPPDACVIGKIARLFHLKGHTYVLDAARRIIDRMPNVYFLFVGDGILEKPLKEKVRRLGIEEHVRFAGLVPPETIPQYMQAMDIVVHASLREGLPRVVPQAFLSHRCVVAFDIDGAHDIIDEGVSGCLIPPKDSEKLAAALCLLAGDPVRRAAWAEAGYQKTVKLFSKEKMVDAISTVYQEFLSKKQ